jgi:small redox-active disulfide protein 2
MEIKVLGPGCQKCTIMERVVRETIAENGIDATVTKVSDIMDIMSYNVMVVPSLVVDEKVVIKGRVPTKEEVLKVLTQ